MLSLKQCVHSEKMSDKQTVPLNLRSFNFSRALFQGILNGWKFQIQTLHITTENLIPITAHFHAGTGHPLHYKKSFLNKSDLMKKQRKTVNFYSDFNFVLVKVQSPWTEQLWSSARGSFRSFWLFGKGKQDSSLNATAKRKTVHFWQWFNSKDGRANQSPITKDWTTLNFNQRIILQLLVISKR